MTPVLAILLTVAHRALLASLCASGRGYLETRERRPAACSAPCRSTPSWTVPLRREARARQPISPCAPRPV
jgi:hypothetical protein